MRFAMPVVLSVWLLIACSAESQPVVFAPPITFEENNAEESPPGSSGPLVTSYSIDDVTIDNMLTTTYIRPSDDVGLLEFLEMYFGRSDRDHRLVHGHVTKVTLSFRACIRRYYCPQRIVTVLFADGKIMEASTRRVVLPSPGCAVLIYDALNRAWETAQQCSEVPPAALNVIQEMSDKVKQ